jgi:uncharacterized protein YndB with AHSA1/START domain
MAANFVAKATTTINAPASLVWKALTDPEIIRTYMFGTEMTTDWKVGSRITWQGNYEGKAYEDKGQILQLLPEKLLQYTYHSSMSGIEDRPENYFNITYELEEENGQTNVTLINSNLPDEQSQQHSQKNWETVLGKMKEVVEQRNSVVTEAQA